MGGEYISGNLFLYINASNLITGENWRLPYMFRTFQIIIMLYCEVLKYNGQ